MSRTFLRVFLTLLSIVFVIGGTYLAIQFGRGYRISRDGNLSGTGLLAANSFPPGAIIYINGEASGQVTDETINLKPGTYEVKVEKEGYTSWGKNLQIEAGVVTQTNSELFRTVPSLTPLSFSGAININPSPDGQKIAFVNASPSGELKAGLYVLDLSENPLSLSRSPRQIAQNPVGLDFGKANLLWSPDSSQILASFDRANYLLDAGTLNKKESLRDATTELTALLTSWEEEITKREKQLLLTLPEEIISIASDSAKNIYFSPNGEKILYTATREITLPSNLKNQLPGSNTQPEERTLKVGNTYVYDIKEDRNFKALEHPDELPLETFSKINLASDILEDVKTATPSAINTKLQGKSITETISNFRAQYSTQSFTSYQWFPTSNHILVNRNGSIDIIEYDGTNQVTLYAGAYEKDFAYPWPNGDKLIILTNITGNSTVAPNLYAVGLK